MGGPHISPHQNKKSNASGDLKIDNDNDQKKFLDTHHWIHSSILHLMVSIQELFYVTNIEGI